VVGTKSSTYLGDTYTNDTGLDEKVVFAGSEKFQVKEIEVFEITVSTDLHSNLFVLRTPK
jgi:hypothetical protein